MLLDPSIALDETAHALHAFTQPHHGVPTERCGQRGHQAGPGAVFAAHDHTHDDVDGDEEDEAAEQLDRGLDAFVRRLLAHLLHDLERNDVDDDPDRREGQGQHGLERGPEEGEPQPPPGVAGDELGVVEPEQAEVPFVRSERCEEVLHRSAVDRPRHRRQTGGHTHLIGQLDVRRQLVPRRADDDLGDAGEQTGLRPRRIGRAHPVQLRGQVIGEGPHRFTAVRPVGLHPVTDVGRLADPHAARVERNRAFAS